MMSEAHIHTRHTALTATRENKDKCSTCGKDICTLRSPDGYLCTKDAGHKDDHVNEWPSVSKTWQSNAITDYPVIRYEDDVPVYCVPIEMVRDNPTPLRLYEEGDAEVMAGHLADGQKRPVFVKADGTIIDGQRRVNGLRHLQCKFVDVVVATDDDALEAVQMLLNRTTIIN